MRWKDHEKKQLHTVPGFRDINLPHSSLLVLFLYLFFITNKKHPPSKKFTTIKYYHLNDHFFFFPCIMYNYSKLKPMPPN